MLGGVLTAVIVQAILILFIMIALGRNCTLLMIICYLEEESVKNNQNYYYWKKKREINLDNKKIIFRFFFLYYNNYFDFYTFFLLIIILYHILGGFKRIIQCNSVGFVQSFIKMRIIKIIHRFLRVISTIIATWCT